METKRREIHFLSELRAVSCIAIVLLHTFYAASAYAAPGSTAHLVAISVRNLMMWAVPCFVMVSGALLLDQARVITYRKIFQKYILRILLALVLFSVGFQVFDDITGNSGLHLTTLLHGLQNAVTGQGWKHMWYLYLIIALYLLLPFYRKIAAGLTKKTATTCWVYTLSFYP